MKRIVVFLCAVALSTCCLAAEVSKEQAMEQAKAFICQQSAGATIQQTRDSILQVITGATMPVPTQAAPKDNLFGK